MRVRGLIAVLALAGGLVLFGAEAPAFAYGDWNTNGVIDLDDYAQFSACLTGPGGGVGTGCDVFDFDADTDVDVFDFAAFQRVFGTSTPLEMVFISAGEFEMGDSFGDGIWVELPVHTVYLSPYSINTHEVTNQQYADGLNWAYGQGGLIEVTGGVVYKYNSGTSYPYCDTDSYDSGSCIVWNGSTFAVESGRENQPMVKVSWYGSAAYANWRSAMDGRTPCYDTTPWTCNFAANGYRLPTEAEWEKAARGGVPGHRFPWSDTDTIQHARANYRSYWSGGAPYYPYDTSPTDGYHPDFDDEGYPYTSPVAYFAPNGYGLYDATGNVREWCNDWYEMGYYGSSPYDNPQGPVSGTHRVARGGNWYDDAYSCRCAYRTGKTPDDRYYYLGFRLTLDSE